jgi:hypothetical protein
MVGMTCAACHTREIVSNGIAYRIDGGPAIVDFQSFLADLHIAVATVLGSDTDFADFATAVLGPSPTPEKQAALRTAVEAWFLRYDTLMKNALPTPPWGMGRLDAVAMIFNRLTGLDLGPPPSNLIAENIQPATAPVRYPFLWNAAIQDLTQWPGFASNGNSILGLARNLGEVMGVFATFAPQKAWYGIDYLTVNSANFPGLLALEELIRKIGPPQWPWTVNNTLADQGEAVFNRPTASGGCVDCHGIEPGITRPIDEKTWATPVMNVGTDTHEYDILAWTAKTGVLKGVSTLADSTPLKAEDAAINVLGIALTGSIEQFCLEHPIDCGSQALESSPTVGGGAWPRRKDWQRLRIPRSRGHLGRRPLSPQRLGAHSGTTADASRPARADLRRRPRLRPGQHRPRRHPDPVRLHLPGHRLRRSGLGQQQLRPRIRDDAVGVGQGGAARVFEDAVRRLKSGSGHTALIASACGA